MKSFLYCGMPGVLVFSAVAAWDYYRCGDDPSAAGAYLLHALVVGGLLGAFTSVVAAMVILARMFGKDN